MYATPALLLKVRQISELNVCWNMAISKIFGYHRWESVKMVIDGLGRVDVIHLIQLRMIAFYRRIFTARRYAKRGICRRRVSVCLCVCLSHYGIVSKRLNVGSRK